MPNITRTANGVSLDMEALRSQNEKTVSVGNMRVNARGDELNTAGEVSKTRNQRMTEYYKLHSTVPVQKNHNRRPNDLVEVTVSAKTPASTGDRK